jgi:transposase-like protein
MFSSHEQKGDYLKFFQKMVEVALLVDVILEPKFMVIDACKAIAYAIKKYFPKCKIIMCWFRLKSNIRKHKQLLRSKYKKVLSHINLLQNTSNEFEFRVLWSKIEKKWQKKPSMSKFLKYFKAQWMDSIFCNWQIFQTPPGFTTTNNPIESYNAMIKNFSPTD